MKIYTKTGDKGTSQLYSGERRPKDDQVFMALGDIDELNAQLGVSMEHLVISKKNDDPSNTSSTLEQKESLREQLQVIQSRLFDAGSAVATPLSSGSTTKILRTAFSSEYVLFLERAIDAMEQELVPLKNFILPSGGGLTSSQLQVARAVCRRAERRVVGLIEQEQVDREVGRYLNRLSDYLFVAARYCAHLAGSTENIWTKE